MRWFKVYRHIRPTDLKIVLEEAHRGGAKVRGHLCSITFSQAAELGIDAIEHGLNSAADFRPTQRTGVCQASSAHLDKLDSNAPEVKKLLQHLIDQGVVLTSTLAIYESSVPNRSFADSRSLAAMSPQWVRQYTARRQRLDTQQADDSRAQRFKKMMAFERLFFQMGGVLCSGVDAGRHVLPGFGDQRNFELLVEAGFTVEEAIQVMTFNAAQVLGRTDIGAIQSGRRADFLIINGNLAQDPLNIRNVVRVYKKGLAHDPQEILASTAGQLGPTDSVSAPQQDNQ